MIFTLEALQAAHGDALLLHYGPADSAKLAVIDAGPLGIYKSSVRPRLEEIRARRSPDATLALDYVLVSHIDDDHIHGITDLTKELVEAADAPGDPPFEITNLWNGQIVSHVGNHYIIRNAAWNGAIGPNGTVSFGFQASYTGSSPQPTSASWMVSFPAAWT